MKKSNPSLFNTLVLQFIQHMKIAIDESGDNGRKFWRGSSRWFILTAVIVPDDMLCGPTCQAIHKYSVEYNWGRELHFSHSSHQQHLEFFKYMEDKDYIFASLCIDKQRLIIKKPYLFRRKMTLLQFAFDQLFVELKPWLDSPVVLIDTSGPIGFNKALSRHLIKQFGSKHKGDIHSIQQARSVDSTAEPLVQLADYVAGAVHHHIDGQHDTKTFEQYLEDKGKLIFVG